MSVPLDLVEKYGRTWLDFVLARPKRFFELHQQQPDRHLSPILFAAVTLVLYSAIFGAALTLVSSYSHSGESQFGRTIAARLDAKAFVVAIVVAGLPFMTIDLLIAKLVAWIARRRASIGRLLAAKCYALSLVLLGAVLQIWWNLSYLVLDAFDVQINTVVAGFIEIGVGLLIGMIASLYAIGAMAAFNGIRFRRYLFAYAIVALPVVFLGAYLTLHR